MCVKPQVKLGDLITFASGPTNPCDFGIVVEITEEFVKVLWHWGLIECTHATFSGERWGNLKVVTDEA